MQNISSDVIRRAATGDERAFAELVNAYQTLVYNTALSILRDRENALDVSQEVFLKVYRFLPSFHFESAFSTWLYRLTRNAALDHLRKNKKRIASSTEELAEQGFLPAEAEETTDPFTEMLREERRQMLYDAIEELPEHHREIIRMACFSGMAYDAIAEVLGIELGTVKSRLFRAKQELRKLLEKRNYF